MTRRFLIGVAVALVTAAQTPHIGQIDFYGLRKISSARILRDLKLRPGDPLPASSADLEERVTKIPGVLDARVEGVCCEGPDAILFIGVEERGGPRVSFRSEPGGEVTLPKDVADDYQAYTAAVNRTGRVQSDDVTQPMQQRFMRFAASYPDRLDQVLRTAAEPDQRAIAATVLGYGPRKQETIDALEYALQDPEDLVRANAFESLRIFALLSVKRPDLSLKISPAWPIELLNSVALNDRMQATDLLITLTDKENRPILDQIRARALPALVEMARWPSLRYALPPFMLVGRIAGLSEQEIRRRWSSGQRETVIRKALRPPARKR